MLRTSGLLVLLILLADVALAQVNIDSSKPTETRITDRQSVLDAVIQKQIRQQGLVGVCVGVIQDGEIVYSKGFGFQDREKSVKSGRKTMFRWASISKPVTAIAALQLVEKGQLSLDDDVRKYVPEFPDHGHVVRVRDLMCHQSGIVHYRNGRVVKTLRKYESDHPYENVILALDTFRESPLIHPPGSKVSYSTHAYILLSAVVERAGNKKFFEQVNERICQPLGLESLQPDYQWVEIPNRAIGYSKARLTGKTVASTDTDVSWKLGGGGFISNIDDMALFAAGLMGDKLINAETKKWMWSPQTLADGTTTNIGLGLFIRGADDQTMILSHNGSQEKTRTRLVISPSTGLGIVVMSNSEYADCGKITTALFQALTLK